MRKIEFMPAYNKDLIEDFSNEFYPESYRYINYFLQNNLRNDGRLDFANGWIEKNRNKEEWKTKYCF